MRANELMKANENEKPKKKENKRKEQKKKKMPTGQGWRRTLENRQKKPFFAFSGNGPSRGYRGVPGGGYNGVPKIPF